MFAIFKLSDVPSKRCYNLPKPLWTKASLQSTMIFIIIVLYM